MQVQHNKIINKSHVRWIFLKFLFVFACAAIICAGCTRAEKERYRILLEPGVALPAITALASPDGDFSSAPCFAFASDDGYIRVVDVFSGKPLVVFPCEEKISSLVFNSGTELVSLSESGKSVTYSLSEDIADGGGKADISGKTFSLVDGAVCMADSATGKEIARYYFFSQPDEWLCILPEGFYNASSGGAASNGSATLVALEIGKSRYRLDRLSGALYRPDLFASLVNNETISGLPFTLENLFKKEQLPPLVSLSFDEAAGELKIKIIEQRGGAGYVALYRRAGEAESLLEIPSGLFDLKADAVKKYSEKGKTCYEINVNVDYIDTSFHEIGVSAFNKAYTVESERSWLRLPSARISSIQAPAKAAPVLRALVAASGENVKEAEELAEIFLLQSEGDLYSDVEVINLFGKDFSRAGFIAACAGLCAQTKKDDVLVICLRSAGFSDLLGNLSIVPGTSGENESRITGEEILASLLSVPSNSLLLLMELDSDLPREKMDTALRRFVGRLGPRAVAASFGSGNGNSLFSFIADGLNLGFAMTEPGIKYLYAEELIAYAAKSFQNTEGQGGLVFLPIDDFSIIDPFINTGELRFQAMSSGMLRIDQVDKTPVPLAFGDTMIRVLPAGRYIIDLTYRNGYKETRTVELRRKESRWVIFSYTLPYLAGDFSALYSQGGRLPGGINISELNPASYQRVNREAMESMGMAPYYVAFLGGEKYYRDGDYDKAIAEYNRCISLKADYPEAYASRGNAYRRKGDVSRAIEDYTRAISLRSSYAEVYNYRGFLFARRGELRRAVEDYTQAIRYKDDYADAYFNRAHAYGELGNWDLAIADYTQVIRLEPKNWSAYNQRGNAWYSKGDRAKAAEDYAVAERLK
jgi:tetratricopeptide (TPR) repeat protein